MRASHLQNIAHVLEDKPRLSVLHDCADLLLFELEQTPVIKPGRCKRPLKGRLCLRRGVALVGVTSRGTLLNTKGTYIFAVLNLNSIKVFQVKTVFGSRADFSSTEVLQVKALLVPELI